MAKRPNLGQITSSVFTVSQLNKAYTKIDNAFDNTLSRDGSTPNTMLADLDMNSNDILNVGVLDGDQINVNEAYIGGKLFTGTLTWRSDWLTATSYQELDLVKKDGVVYVCLEEHSSGTFSVDLAADKWEIFVEATGGGGGGVTDHGDLTGLGDDDHTQYHNDVRGDTRYYTKAQVDTSLSGKADTSHTHAISDVTGLQTALDGKQAAGSYAASSHTHTASEVTDFSEAVDDRVGSLLVAGTNITLTYNDGANTLTVDAAGGGGGAVFPDLWEFYTDCYAAAADNIVQNYTANGTNSIVAWPFAGNPSGSGFMRHSLGGSGAAARVAFGSINIAAAHYLRQGLTIFRSRLALMQLSDGTLSYRASVGILNDLTADPTYGCFFRYNHAVNGGRWEAVTVAGGSPTVSDTGVTAVIDTMAKFEVEVNAAGTSVAFKINGTTVATHTATIPGAGINLGFGSSFIRLAGTAAANVALTDYYHMRQEFTGR